MTEQTIQKEIISYLRSIGLIVIRHNPISPLGDGKFKKLSTLDKGCPDLIIVGDNSICLLLEVKTDKGKQSIYQKAFEKSCKNKSIKYYLVRSLNDVKEVLKNESLV